MKDICFDAGHIVVRNGKGDKDRITVLPDRCRELLRQQITRVLHQHQEDLAAGNGRVWLPHAVAPDPSDEELAAIRLRLRLLRD